MVTKHRAPPRDNIATDGVEITPLRVNAHPDGPKLKYTDELFGVGGSILFQCWDMAGQDVYYNTHQFFLTEKGTFYLLSYRMDSSDVTRLEYWLTVVTAKCKKAPIMLVGTHKDRQMTKDTKKEWQVRMEHYKSKYSNVVGYHFVSNHTQEGIAKLLKDICVIAQKADVKNGDLYVNKPYPVAYLLLQDLALYLREKHRVIPTISWKEWCALGETECGLKERSLADSIPKADQELPKYKAAIMAEKYMMNMVQATTYLHNIGVLVWFDEEGLRDTIILDPEFLVNVFRHVVTAKTVLSTGILYRRNLPNMWRESTFGLGKHDFMLALLQKFDILYQLDHTLDTNDVLNNQNRTWRPEQNSEVEMMKVLDDERRYLVPCMLPPTTPSYADLMQHWPPLANPIGDCHEALRLFQLSTLPVAFFARLMVKLMNAHWKPLYWWREGLIVSKRMFLVSSSCFNLQTLPNCFCKWIRTTRSCWSCSVDLN